MIRLMIAAFLIVSLCSIMISVAGCGGSDGPDSIVDDGELEPEPYDPGPNVPGGGTGGDDGGDTIPQPPAPPGDGIQPPDDGGDGGTPTPPPPPII